MYCPNCRAEYREGFTECADCGVPLVDELPPEAVPVRQPKLPTAALLAIIATTYMFLSRTIGTFVPTLFGNITAAQANVILSIVATGLVLYFFVTFRREYVRQEQETLRSASAMAITGVFLTLLLHLKELTIFAGGGVWVDMANPGMVEALLPLISSGLLLIFFGILYSEVRSGESRRLKTAVLLALAGFATGVLLRTAVLFNYLFTDEFIWLSYIFSAMPVIFLPLTLFMYFSAVYFFLVFYRLQFHSVE